MPVNYRNDQQASMLSSEFVRRNGHLAVYALLPSILRSMHGLRQAWIFDGSAYDATPNFVVAPVKQYSQTHEMLMTSSVGAIATVNTGVVEYRNGWGTKLLLGATITRALYLNDCPMLDLSTAEVVMDSGRKGLTVFAAIQIPPNYTAPALNVSHEIGAKFEGAADYSYSFGYENNSGGTGFTGLRYVQSTNGAVGGIQVWAGDGATTGMQFTAGSANYKTYLVGCSKVGGSGVYLFMNDLWEYVANPQYDPLGTGNAGTPFNGTKPFCWARRSDAATPSPFPNAYWLFGGLLDTWMDPSTFRALYQMLKPILGYNTNFGGT